MSIKYITIENYKSIKKLQLELGIVTVLIGENGCGKSNILEAIALGAAAANNKLDNEFLAARGVRVTEPQLMRSAFQNEDLDRDIKVYVEGEDKLAFKCLLHNDNLPYSKWQDRGVQSLGKADEILAYISQYLQDAKPQADSNSFLTELVREKFAHLENLHLQEFIIYAPQTSALRTFEKEGQIQPLGINGEGLFKLLKYLSQNGEKERLKEIKEKLHLIDWFDDFTVPNNLSLHEQRLEIKDRYLPKDLSYFDQKSANEGFLFLLFYFALLISDKTPRFLAIDNIDSSLNPKLCRRLMVELVNLAKKYHKQIIFTTQNPGILDGLNLTDDCQRLFVIYRGPEGDTQMIRIKQPKPLAGQEPVKLSEAFLRGYIGGLPNNF